MGFTPRNPGIPLPGLIAASAAPSTGATELETEIVSLFDEMRARLLRYVLSFGLPIADAEELVQDIFLALYQHLARGKSRAGLHGWLFKVAHNLSLKRRLAASRILADPIADDAGKESVQIADPAPNPEDQLAFRQRQSCLQSVVRALPETDRECLYLRAEGLRYREISDVLGISVGAVANSLAKSLARLAAVDKR